MINFIWKGVSLFNHKTNRCKWVSVSSSVAAIYHQLNSLYFIKSTKPTNIIHSEQFNWIDSYNWREEKTQDKLYHSYNQMVKKSKERKERIKIKNEKHSLHINMNNLLSG